VSEARAGRAVQGRVGTAVNGKWVIDARIGAGGMATVYAATHRNGRRAALKMLHPNLSRDASTRARFLREGYVANAVGHPGVVAVIDDGISEDGVAFLVLELLEGETIEARRVRLGGTMPVEEVLDFADQALDALAAAHDKGIVHRDIKPENVFLTNEGTIKLLDFGLARMIDVQAEATRTGVTIGTPEFMPPEQAMGKRAEVDARSDVWALGSTLYKAITGEYVHDAHTVHEQLIASATRRSRPIRQLAPHVAPAIARVIDKSLELEKGDRWQSAKEMQLALREARRNSIDVQLESRTVTVALPDDGVVSVDLASETPSFTNEQTMRLDRAIVREFAEQVDVESTYVSDANHSPYPAPAAPRYDSERARENRRMDAVATEEPPLGRDRTTRMARAPVPSIPDDVPHSPRPSRPSRLSHPQGAFPNPIYATPRSARPTVATRRRHGSASVILYLSLLLVVVCATMGAYVLWRGS
jgi:eukaryotic-like serine/threonine-protein kinase